MRLLLGPAPTTCTRTWAARPGVVCGSDLLSWLDDYTVECLACGGVGHRALVDVDGAGVVRRISYVGACCPVT